MRVASWGIGLAMAAALGGGYYSADGDADFTVEVGRSPDDVYAAFSDIRRTSRGLRDFGISIPAIDEQRPSARELVFTMDSANPGERSRIGFTFAPGDGPVSTVVTVAVDVPPVRYGDTVLSEAKVEGEFRKAVEALGKRLDDGNSVTTASAKLAMLIDTVAIAANPADYAALEARLRKIEGEIAEAKAGLERDGYQVTERGDGDGYDIGYADEAAAE